MPSTADIKAAARLARREAALALRPEISPVAPAPDRLRLATWNLNSLGARLPAVERFLQRVRPDVLCVQETKAPALSAEATKMFARHSYVAVHVGAGPYNGIAIAARHPVDDVVGSGEFGDAALDREPRILACLVGTPLPLRVVSVYVPHGRALDHWHYEYKLAFLDALTAEVTGWLANDAHVMVAGDINVAPTDSDVFHPDAFVGATHVSDAEREAVADFSKPASSTWTSPAGGRGPGGSPGGTMGSGTPATSACASTTSPSTARSPSGWTRRGSTTPNGAGNGHPTTPP